LKVRIAANFNGILRVTPHNSSCKIWRHLSGSGL